MSNTGSIPDFVKKLFNMLEENTYPHVFSWGKEGDTFVVKDTNEFARHILPRHFKHSNFASFVRQLNKYDFHKLRLPEDGQRIYGDQAWEFTHPNFKYNRRDLLEEIKRKPSGKVPQNVSTTTEIPASSSPVSGVKPPTEEGLKSLAASLQKEIASMKETQKEMADTVKSFDQKYNSILRNVEGFRRNMEEQDLLVKSIMSFITKQKEQEVTDQGLNALLQQYNDMTHTGKTQLDRLNTVFSASQSSPPSSATSSPASRPSASPPQKKRMLDNGIVVATATTTPTIAAVPTTTVPSMLMAADTATLSSVIAADLVNPQSISLIPSKKRKRLQPGWTVPPKVLLVDDDSIFRRLSTRLLQMAGCIIDVAVDGEEAVNKLGTDRYDLVLMDIMMPKLDGMSATRNIRRYDTLTPIISMTSNTTDQDIQQYILSGMTDVLPKPLNQGALGSLLERYCAHLVLQKHQQQQMQLLQQNFSLNNTLIDLNMTPQLTLLDEEESEGGKGKEKETAGQENVQFLTAFNPQNTLYTPQSIIPSTQTISYVPTQSLQPNPSWFLYQKQSDS
ncbi:hypothetical protein BY458DRAFT_517808 [Sporodiniella umbellata]|nr:hypothetical protein BY458DRAFT_517808 [Sporodiniella umbellata]